MTTHKFHGRVIHRSTKAGLPNLRVEGWDVRNVVHDMVCAAPTGADGAFVIEVDDEDLDLLFGKSRTVLYFRVMDGDQIRAATDRTMRWYARGDGEGDIEVDPSRIVGRAPAVTKYSVDVLVVDPATGPINGAKVRLFDVDLSASGTVETEHNPSTTYTTDARGRVRIDYEPIVGGVRKAQPRLKVRAEDGGSPLAEAVICRAKPRERVTLVKGGGTWAGLTRYASTLERVTSVLGPATLANLTSGQMDVVACRANVPRDDVDQIASAAKMNAAASAISTEVFYGLIRGGLPRNLPDLATLRLPHIRGVLEESIARNDVSPGISANLTSTMNAIENALVAEQFRTRTDGVPAGVVADQTQDTTPAQREAFIRIALNHDGDAASFWAAVAANGTAGPVADKLRVTAEAAPLVASHPPMLSLISTRFKNGLLENHRSLSEYDDLQWRGIIDTLPTGQRWPAGTPGANDTEKRNNYAASIAARVEARFRTRTIAWRIRQASAGDHMNKFFFDATGREKNGAFDFAGARVARYLKENPTAMNDVFAAGGQNAVDEVERRLKTMERLYRVTDNFAEMNALMTHPTRPVKSASHIHEMGFSNFKATFESSLLPADKLKQIFERACWTTASAKAHYSKYSPKFQHSKGKPKVIPDLGTPLAQAFLPEKVADWVTLFGSLDSCACEHCQSVYGPAAYLVDLLRFLSKQKLEGSSSFADSKLFGYRPDIPLIALNCESATTPLPYIDIVNEVLEVGAAKLLVEPDPAMPAPPITTNRDADELLGAPETPYPAHFDAAYRYFAGHTVGTNPIVAYPPKSVFHLWTEEARVLLEHLGVPRYELLRVLEKAAPHAEYPQWIAAERLGLSRRGYRLIAEIEGTVDDLWGISGTSWATSMPTFLRRARISFEEARELFAAPLATTGATINADVADPCDTTKMTISGLTSGKLGLISRLLRLRTALGWTIHELEQTVANVGANTLDDTLVRKLARVEDFRGRLGLSPLQSAALYGNLSRHKGLRKRSFFGDVFLSKTVADPDTAVFQTIDDPLGTPSGALDAHKPAILAALNLTNEDYLLLVAPGGDPKSDNTHPLFVRWPVESLNIDITTLSRLYRLATFTQALGIPLREYLVLRAYANKQVLEKDGGAQGASGGAGVPDQAVEFLELVDTIRSLGIDVAELDFYLRDFATTASKLKPSDEEVSFWETELMAGVSQAMKAADAITDDSAGTATSKLLAILLPTPPHLSDTIPKIVDIIKTGSGNANDLLPLQPFVRHMNDTRDKLIGVGALPELADRYTHVAQQLTRYIDSFNFVVQWLAAKFQIDAATMRHLVTVPLKRPNAVTQSAIRELLPDLDPVNTAAPPAVPDPFEGTVADRKILLRRIQKAAGIVRQLGLSTKEVEQLFPATAGQLPYVALNELPVQSPVTAIEFETGPSTARSRFEAWLRVARIVELRRSWKAGSVHLFSVFASTELLPDLQKRIAAGTDWPLPDITTLCESFNLTASSFKDESGLIKLKKAMAALLRMGVSAAEAATWADLSLGLPNNLQVPEAAPDNAVRVARSIRRIARSRNGQSGWRDVIRPLRDRLREKQRDALVEFLLHRKNQNEPRDLFDDMLLDVEMSPCQLTSRIVQASGSVQTFVQRSMLRYYNDFKLDEAGANHWRWMKNYRVWEANRKIFLYPENWIEPDLRDDKSPLFEAFERQLRQGPVTVDRVEAAYRAYLEGIEELSTLDVRAVCVHTKDGVQPSNTLAANRISHVFARTRAPHRYFYRRWEDGAWQPWEKLEIDVESDHLMPIFYQGSLYLFWPTFQEVEHPETSFDSESPPNLNTRLGFRYVERRHGQWTASQDIGLTLDMGGSPPTKALSFQVFESDGQLGIDVLGHSTLPDGADDGSGSKGVNHLAIFLFDPLRPDKVSLPAFVYLEASSERQLSPMIFSTRYVGLPFNTRHDGQRFVRRDGEADGRLWLFFSDGSGPVSEKQILGDVPRGFRLVVPRTQEKTTERPLVVLQDATRSFVARIVEAVSFESNGAPPILFDNQSSFTGIEATWHRSYRFERLDHSHIYEFRKALAAHGIDGLLRRSSQSTPKLQDLGGSADFSPSYGPSSLVENPFPKNEVEFRHGSPMGIYNWELFFHLPFAIAVSLSRQGRYEDALRWFHYIFDPTDGSAATDKAASYWKFKPFYENEDLATVQQQLTGLSQNTYVQQVSAWTDASMSNAVDESFQAQIASWRKNPFNPHAIARLRPVAYQKAVVIKYVDTLVAWADQLFTRDTMESVNEATQLYLMAWDILGPRPNVVPTPAPAPKTYTELQNLDAFGNAFLENVEAIAKYNPKLSYDCDNVQPPPLIGSTYFCIPPNAELLGKWDVIEDRLFKIRHCQNIEGITRQLPLFAPPIDPAVLVQAAAFGIDIQSVLNDLASGAPAYRFTVLQQKAVEFTSFVSSLGAQLLSALEKKDAEHLANLRASQEVEVHDAVRETRKQQLAAAKQDLAAVKQARKLAEDRRDFYEKAQGNNALEEGALFTSILAQGVKITAEAIRLNAAGSHPAPNSAHGTAGTLGTPVEVVIVGGPGVGASSDSSAEAVSVVADTLQWGASTMATQASYQRRDEEFELQEELAKKEITQIDKQIAAAELRVAVAEHELRLTEKQLVQARDVRRTLLEKFTKEDLYDWMVGEAAATHYQAYKLAYDLAKKAERAFQIERGDTSQTYVRFGYWDDVRKGLLAGEKLALDLRKLDAAYHEQNKRELELTKNVSLVKHAPEELLRLRETGSCSFDLTEKDYDKDYPTHYLRRLKQVSVTVPCTTGPYEGVLGALTLFRGDTRIKPTDANRTSLFHGIQTICTSTAQTDGGTFELAFRDERLLPFEGAGAHAEVSESEGPQWRFDLKPGNELDYDSISDLVLHVRYTARQGRAQPANLFGSASPRKRLFRLKRDFADAWRAFMEGTQTDINVALMQSSFPRARAEALDKLLHLAIYVKWSDTADHPAPTASTPTGTTISIVPHGTLGSLKRFRNGPASPSQPTPINWDLNNVNTTWKINVDKTNLVDAWIIVDYALKPAP